MKALHSIARMFLVALILTPPLYWLWARWAIKSEAQCHALADWVMAPVLGRESA